MAAVPPPPKRKRKEKECPWLGTSWSDAEEEHDAYMRERRETRQRELEEKAARRERKEARRLRREKRRAKREKKKEKEKRVGLSNGSINEPRLAPPAHRA